MRPRTKSGTARPSSAKIPDTNVAINHATKRVRMSVPTSSCTGGMSTSASLRISLNLCHHRVCSSDCSVPSKMRLGSGSRASFLLAPAVVTKSDRRLRTVLPLGRRAMISAKLSSAEMRTHMTNNVMPELFVDPSQVGGCGSLSECAAGRGCQLLERGRTEGLRVQADREDSDVRVVGQLSDLVEAERAAGVRPVGEQDDGARLVLRGQDQRDRLSDGVVNVGAAGESRCAGERTVDLALGASEGEQQFVRGVERKH